MGMQGPLTAQALGRSPYDETIEWDAKVDGDAPEITQQYDHRGRPVNPETKRINRDIIRSHNEVMLVIGVAETEPAATGPEVDSETRHDEYEESMGMVFMSAAIRCVEAVGVFGLHGLRQRILVYNRYSKIPFWDLFQQSRHDFSIARDILPGAPASLISSYYERYLANLWVGRVDRVFARRFIHEIWSYTRVHLELFAATQRLGLVSSSQWLPPLSYFIPFTKASPIPAPPPLQDLSFRSVLQWVGGVFVSATPFLVWVMTQRLVRDWKPQIWQYIYVRLPNTHFPGKWLPVPPSAQPGGETRTRPEPGHSHGPSDEVSPLRAVDGHLPSDQGPVEAVRRASTFSARGDDYATDDEESGEVSATLISFDVEATEASEAPPGLWSAELRPSVAPDSKNTASRGPSYLDTMLTRLPAHFASHIFGEAITRLVIAPYEATALRLVARAIRLQHGLPCSDIYPVSLLGGGLSSTSFINFLGVEFFHLLITGEIWGAVTGATLVFHMSEEEWKLHEQGQLGQQQQ